jgi:hypothetical protein
LLVIATSFSTLQLNDPLKFVFETSATIGNLPTQLNKLDSLKEFSVYSNEELTGPVLDFSKVSKIEKLE